jgi:hypothetical protein
MILSSADILRVLGSSEVIRLSAKIQIVDSKPVLSGREGVYIYIDRFPAIQEFEATWQIWVESDDDVLEDLVLKAIASSLPSVKILSKGLMVRLTTTDFNSSNTQKPPEQPKPTQEIANVQFFEERFQALAEEIQDQMLLVTSGRPGKDGRNGTDGADGRDGRDLVATDANLEDLQNVEANIAYEKGQVLTWDGEKWTNLFVPQIISSINNPGGKQLPDGNFEDQPLTWDGASWQPGSSVQLDTTNTEDPCQGEIAWEQDEHTAVLGINGLHLHIGHDQYAWCRNSTDSEITKGTAVMFAGTLGASGRLLVEPMVSDGTYPGYVFLGIAAENIPPGEDGNIISYGKLKNYDTSDLTGGAILWCDPATPGGLTETEPSAPNLKLPVAAVISKKNNGTLMVRWAIGSKLDDLHNVEVGSPSDGDVLRYNATNERWEADADAPSDGDHYVRLDGAWVRLIDALSDLGVPMAGPIDGGNFTTNETTAVNSQPYDGGDFS